MQTRLQNTQHHAGTAPVKRNRTAAKQTRGDSFWMLLATFAAMLFLYIGQAAAQGGTGQIKGVVTDSTGAVVPGAKVTAISGENGFVRATVSGADGSFLIPLLDPQHYRLVVVAPGFKRLERGPITVQVTETADVGHVALTIGAQSETVTVEAQAQLLDTENATLGKVFDANFIEQVPLSTRNFTQLLGLQAGVIGNIPDTLAFGNGTSSFSVGGGTENAINIDGVSATSSSTGAFSVPSPDALAEFKMQTSAYSAEYGRANGGSVDVTTKTGTNQFHGDGFYFFRDRNLDANLYFLKQTQAINNEPNTPPDLKQNQFGGTIGGPIKRDKLFFFFSYQNTKQVNGNTGLSINDSYPVLPDGDRSNTGALQAFLGQNYGGQAGLFGGEAVAADGSNINPVSLAIIQHKLSNGQYLLPYEKPQDVLGLGRTDVAQLVFDFPDVYTEKQYLGNVDYKLTSKQTLSTKYFNSHTLVSAANASIPGFTQEKPSVSENAVITHSYVLTPTLVNEFKLGFLRQSSDQVNDNSGLKASSVGMLQTPDALDGFPSFIWALNGVTFPSSQLATLPTTENQFSISDVVNKVKGRHNLRFGGAVYQHQLDLNQSRTGAIIVYNAADFLIGQDAAHNGSGFSNLLVTTEVSGNFKRHFLFNDYSPFIQDDYKIRPNLTLNLGLRYDYFAWPTEKDGLMDNFVPSLIGEGQFGIPSVDQEYTGYTISQKFKQKNPSFNLPAGVKTVNDQLGLTPNYKNFAPRVGFAWNPEKGLAIHAGFGLFFTRVSTGIAQGLIEGPPFDDVAFYSFGSDGTLQDPFSHLNLPPDSAYPLFAPRQYNPASASTLLYDAATPVLRNPYTEQFNLSVQQQLGNDFLFELAYQGENGVKLLRGLSQNQAGVASAAHPIRGLNTNKTLGDPCGCGSQDIANRSPVAGILSDQGLIVSQSTGSNHFNALEATLSKRLSHGLQFLTAFTWSRAFDGLSSEGDNTISNHMTISGGDRTLRLTTAAVYQLGNLINNPTNLAEKALNHGVGGWNIATSITAQSGTPIGFQFANTTIGTSAIKLQSNLDYDLKPGYTINSIKSHGPTKNRLNNYFNTGKLFYENPTTSAQYQCGDQMSVGGQAAYAKTAFACPGPLSFGNLPPTISSLRTPGQKTVDVSITKLLPIYKEYHLEFRADAFNVFNWAEFGAPDSGPSDPTFGLINSTTVEPRVLQLAMKFKF
jgi:hypothetical protein